MKNEQDIMMKNMAKALLSKEEYPKFFVSKKKEYTELFQNIITLYEHSLAAIMDSIIQENVEWVVNDITDLIKKECKDPDILRITEVRIKFKNLGPYLENNPLAIRQFQEVAVKIAMTYCFNPAEAEEFRDVVINVLDVILSKRSKHSQEGDVIVVMRIIHK